MARSIENNGVLIVLSGPSGVGKDAVLEGVKTKLPDSKMVVTYTSRAIRKDVNGNDLEQEGREYHFVSRTDFEKKIEEGFFLEWTAYRVDPVTGEPEYKGTPKITEELKDGSDHIWRIDPNRAAKLEEVFCPSDWEAVQQRMVLVYLGVDSLQNWIARRQGRDCKPMSEILPNMRKDYAVWKEHQTIFRNNLVINCQNCLEATVDEVIRRVETVRENIGK